MFFINLVSCLRVSDLLYFSVTKANIFAKEKYLHFIFRLTNFLETSFCILASNVISNKLESAKNCILIKISNGDKRMEKLNHFVKETRQKMGVGEQAKRYELNAQNSVTASVNTVARVSTIQLQDLLFSWGSYSFLPLVSSSQLNYPPSFPHDDVTNGGCVTTVQ